MLLSKGKQRGCTKNPRHQVCTAVPAPSLPMASPSPPLTHCWYQSPHGPLAPPQALCSVEGGRPCCHKDRRHFVLRQKALSSLQVCLGTVRVVLRYHQPKADAGNSNPRFRSTPWCKIMHTTRREKGIKRLKVSLSIFFLLIDFPPIPLFLVQGREDTE